MPLFSAEVLCPLWVESSQEPPTTKDFIKRPFWSGRPDSAFSKLFLGGLADLLLFVPIRDIVRFVKIEPRL